MEMYPKANKTPSTAIRYLSTECKEERRRMTGLVQAPNSKRKSRKDFKGTIEPGGTGENDNFS